MSMQYYSYVRTQIIPELFCIDDGGLAENCARFCQRDALRTSDQVGMVTKTDDFYCFCLYQNRDTPSTNGDIEKGSGNAGSGRVNSIAEGSSPWNCYPLKVRPKDFFMN